MYLFMQAASLTSANLHGLPSYPSNAPRKQLDFVLYGRGIRVTHFEMPPIQLSDHLPIVCEFDIRRFADSAAGATQAQL
jgi:endonuclease/exonuclease/phosphatase family metal-dependent hydrolase